MDTNSASEMWKEFCFLLSDNISVTTTEKEFEYQVVRAIEALGWSEFKGEIERQPTVKMGRKGTLRPDLIIYNQKRKALIVTEVKKPVPSITGDDSIGQLMSYMRQMKSDFGLLIGNDLRVYYDGSLNPQSGPLLLEKIPFDKNSPSGKLFVENFNRDDFLENKYNQYLEGKIKKFSQKQEIAKLVEILVSDETKEKINKFLETAYVDFGPETYSAAMKEVSIDIKRLQNPPDHPGKIVKTVKEKGIKKNTKRRYGISIGDLISTSLLKPGEILTMTYGPRGGTKETFKATVNSDGSLSVQGTKFSSPSAAAEYCMNLSGTQRTADGWIHWKNNGGSFLADLRMRV